MNKILAYSAIKINANNPLPYSMLKPDTSSDSPSAKSKGVRFVSANEFKIQITIKGKNNTIFMRNKLKLIHLVILRDTNITL